MPNLLDFSVVRVYMTVPPGMCLVVLEMTQSNLPFNYTIEMTNLKKLQSTHTWNWLQSISLLHNTGHCVSEDGRDALPKQHKTLIQLLNHVGADAGGGPMCLVNYS